MPNHVSNRITFVGKTKEDIDNVIKTLNRTIVREPMAWEEQGKPVEETTYFCLDHIFKMPEVLTDTQPWTAKTLTGLATSILRSNPKATLKSIDKAISESTEGTREDKKQAKKNIRLIKKWGFDSWYEWRVFNWGTKWDTYDDEMYRSSDTEVVFYFNTAWSAPFACYNKLPEMFPNVTFDVIWADEDWGCNTGHAWYNEEDGFDYYIPDNESNDAYSILFELDDYAREHYEFKDGHWVYIDEDVEEE